jgi:hypothetical protein
MLQLAGWDVVKQQSRPPDGFAVPRPREVRESLHRACAVAVGAHCLPNRAPGAEAAGREDRQRSDSGPQRSRQYRSRRPPDARLGAHTEIIFIEGNSTDNTWAEIQRVQAAYPDVDIKTMRQSGKGKGNAVREAFDAATGEVLMILDADLTMPPEELTKFYNVIESGRADFANGVRLVYPMEGKAMQFCNFCANKFFGLAFSWALGQPIKDTLCGTKVLAKKDYERIAANRAHFGDFDPSAISICCLAPTIFT